jgi:3-hydroxyacyl-CoA dehydrogenase
MKMEIHRVGIVGCGVMGSGIGQLCGQQGYPVVICEKDEAFLKKGLDATGSALERLVKAGRISEAERDEALGRIRGTGDLQGLERYDLVIEAVTEDLDLKKGIGLDTVALGTEAMQREFDDPQYACPVTTRRMVSAGWLGRKSGKGFYDH